MKISPHFSRLTVDTDASLCSFQQDGKDLDDDPRSGRTTFGVMRLLHGQMEDTLEVECGISKHSDPVDLPVERIRIRF